VPTLFKKQFKGHYEKLQEILELSYDSIEKGVSTEEFQSLLLRPISFAYITGNLKSANTTSQ
jgi:hypothetical protein